LITVGRTILPRELGLLNLFRCALRAPFFLLSRLRLRAAPARAFVELRGESFERAHVARGRDAFEFGAPGRKRGEFTLQRVESRADLLRRAFGFRVAREAARGFLLQGRVLVNFQLDGWRAFSVIIREPHTRAV